ncbi:MAG: nucleotidyltransferase family protein [Armatimonadota bacterium]
MLVGCIILAGGETSAEFATKTGVTNKACLVVNGKPIVQSVIEAVINSGRVENVVVVGNVPAPNGISKVADKGSFVNNLYGGLTELGPTEYVLIATADAPFLTAEAVADFVDQSLQKGVDVCWPIIPVEECKRLFPNMARTTLKVAEGSFTGGNLFMAKAVALQRVRPMINTFFEARKSVKQIASLLGPVMIVRLILGRLFPSLLGIHHIKTRLNEVMGVNFEEIITHDAGVGVDVDKLEHVDALRALGYSVGKGA